MKKQVFRELYYGNNKEPKVIKTKNPAKKETVNKKDKKIIKKTTTKRGK